MTAARVKKKILNMAAIDDDRDPLPIRPFRDANGMVMLTSKKQMRARMRRKMKRGLVSPEQNALYKPLEEWDAEELARGRPRDKGGQFRGQAPLWITREVHEQSLTRFKQLIRDDLNHATNNAMTTIEWILACDELDDKGKPVVSAAVKLSAATFLVEQLLGKPKQHLEADISVRLQGLLASSIITPGTLPAYPDAKELTSPRSIEDAEWSEED